MSPSFPKVVRVQDFWRVNSYGYPCFFGESDNAKEAWHTLLSFYEFTNYEELKTYWSSNSPPRRLSTHAVESWKATFEEFGILYVESRSNRITISPAGMQLREAADQGNETEFAWIGLNLLLRYPLRGPRRPKSAAHDNSDLLLYRFIYSALLDLDYYFWWTELERILCRVFQTGDAVDAIEDVRSLRTTPELIDRVDLPADERHGAFYNSLNQVAGHAGMNHLILGRDGSMCPYGVTEQKRKHFIQPTYLGMVRRALSNNTTNDQCASGGYAIARLPSAPLFGDEVAYFTYLGAKVTPMASTATASLSAVDFQGEKVFFLLLDAHYVLESETSITGPVAELCQLARGQRIILSHDEHWTYLLVHKNLIDANNVRVEIRRGRPISDINIVRELQGKS